MQCSWPTFEKKSTTRWSHLTTHRSRQSLNNTFKCSILHDFWCIFSIENSILIFFSVNPWYRNDEVESQGSGVLDYTFIYLAHPGPVTGFSWRKTSKYMPVYVKCLQYTIVKYTTKSPWWFKALHYSLDAPKFNNNKLWWLVLVWLFTFFAMILHRTHQFSRT